MLKIIYYTFKCIKEQDGNTYNFIYKTRIQISLHKNNSRSTTTRGARTVIMNDYAVTDAPFGPHLI